MKIVNSTGAPGEDAQSRTEEGHETTAICEGLFVLPRACLGDKSVTVFTVPPLRRRLQLMGSLILDSAATETARRIELEV
jgi:hypothetical protein